MPRATLWNMLALPMAQGHWAEACSVNRSDNLFVGSQWTAVVAAAFSFCPEQMDIAR